MRRSRTDGSISRFCIAKFQLMEKNKKKGEKKGDNKIAAKSISTFDEYHFLISVSYETLHQHFTSHQNR